MEAQIFGVRKSPGTRKALRFFSERQIRTHFVDMSKRMPSRGELKRFAEKYGVMALVDSTSKRFSELGLHAAARDETWWLALLTQEPLVLQMPLIRLGYLVSIGFVEAKWKDFVVDNR